MKFLILTAVLLSSPSFAASVKYTCECIDTGLECDGGDLMKLNLTAEKISFTLTDRDGDFPRKFSGVIDTKYNPRTNKDSIRYLSKDQNFPSFLVKKKMLKGAATGVVKMPEFGDDGTYGHEWYYECKLVQ
jgi:hypothetical protein